MLFTSKYMAAAILVAFLFSQAVLAKDIPAAPLKSVVTQLANGRIERNGRHVTVRWASLLTGADLGQVYAKLTKWEKAGLTVSGNKSVKLEKRKEDGAVLFIERDGPFFLPDVTFTVRARAKLSPDKAAKISWLRLAGSSEVYLRQWTLLPSDKGVKVQHVFEIALPSLMPNSFLVDRMTRQIKEDVEALSKLTGVVGKPLAVSTPKRLK